MPIERGVLDLLHDPPEFVRRESAGLARFAEEMRNEGWDRDRVLRLPHEPHGYWEAQVATLRDVLKRVELRPGMTLLDVGANSCWASAHFARSGLDVVALDIATVELQGLFSADWWLEAEDLYFERVLSVMFEPALRDESFDVVFCAQVLHHNDPGRLAATMRELARVLKPGGTLLVANEPMRFPTNRKRDPGAEVAHYEGHEHVYYFHEYMSAVRRAGLEVQALPPATPYFSLDPLWLTRDSSVLGSTKVFLQQLARITRITYAGAFWFRVLIGPEAPFRAICRKPDRG
jgi:SAM-dependent methyltransferase